MKKLISIILVIISFVSLLMLLLIINVNILTKYKNIKKISYHNDYLKLVNITDKKDEIKDAYDNVYHDLQIEGYSSDKIKKFYDSNYIRKVTTNIIYNNAQYLLYNKKEEKYYAQNVKSDDKLINDVKNKVNYNFITIDNLIKYKINFTSVNKLKFLRSLFNPIVKVILMLIIIINIIVEYIINKEKILEYIFIPASLCGLLIVLISQIVWINIEKNVSNKFITEFIYPYINVFTKNLLITGIILLIISIIYLSIDQKIDEKVKKILKPRIKNKKC